MIVRSAINKPINSVWDKVELSEEWMESITSTIYKGDEGECSNYRGMPLSSTSYTILSNVLLSRLIPMQRKLLKIIRVDFDARGQLMIIYSAFVTYFRKNGNTIKQCISYLWVSRQAMIQPAGRPCVIFSLSLVYPSDYAVKGKGKANPLQALTGPEGSRRLRLPDFKTIGT
jgi:hypothetical protein